MTTEVDPSHQDLDEAVADLSSGSTTQSLRSSLLNYPVEHGRQYHAYKDGTYARPNDDIELDRLDLMHEMLSIVYDGNLYFAPIGETPGRCLDIGAGSGIWCIEMGDKFPTADITGVDLSANLPAWVPPNVHFEVEDVEEPWTFTRPFDYIHCRYMAVSIGDWPRLMHQCFENVRPGGWVEFGDFDIDYYSQDGSLSKDSPLRRWLDYFDLVSAKTGRTNQPGLRLETWMKEAGFINVQAVKQILPIGTWPKDPKLKRIGAYNIAQLYEGLQGFTLRPFTKLLGWTPEEVEILLMDVRKDLRNRNIHALFDYYIVWGQRPTSIL